MFLYMQCNSRRKLQQWTFSYQFRQKRWRALARLLLKWKKNGNKNWHPSLKLPLVLGSLHCSLSKSTSSYDYLYHIFHRLATVIWKSCSLDIYNDNSSYYTYLFLWFHYNIYLSFEYVSDDIVNAECTRGVYRTSTGSQRFAGIFKCKDCTGDPVSRCSCRESSAIRFLSFLSLTFFSKWFLSHISFCKLWIVRCRVIFFVSQSFFYPTFSDYYISNRSLQFHQIIQQVNIVKLRAPENM